MTKSVRVMLAAGFGGVLGMLVALAVSQNVWWLGALVGGVSAGFLFALPDIIRHTPTAGKTAWRSLVYIPVIIGAILFIFGLRLKMTLSQRLIVAIAWVGSVQLAVLIYFTFRDYNNPNLILFP